MGYSYYIGLMVGSEITKSDRSGLLETLPNHAAQLGLHRASRAPLAETPSQVGLTAASRFCKLNELLLTPLPAPYDPCQSQMSRYLLSGIHLCARLAVAKSVHMSCQQALYVTPAGGQYSIASALIISTRRSVANEAATRLITSCSFSLP